LVDLLAYARIPEHPKAEIDRLATLLRAWSADGGHGRLFDGVTNASRCIAASPISNLGSCPSRRSS
jgi:hypothetical protein